MNGPVRALHALGDGAVLADVDGGTAAVLGLAAALATGRPAGVTDVVPAEATLLVRFDPARAGAAEVARWVRAARPDAGGPAGGGPPVELEVHYDGDDLAEVGGLTGLGVDGVVAAHTGAPWVVAFTGFAPGFGYLAGGDPRLRVPRRERPRTRVPAGAVALAAGYTGVYPRESPGGWQLIGRLAGGPALWDPTRDPPARLIPGTAVRFRSAR